MLAFDRRICIVDSVNSYALNADTGKAVYTRGLGLSPRTRE